MWCAISKLCTKENTSGGDSECRVSEFMDRGEDKRMEPQDTYDSTQSKHRASVKWLLSKAFNNKVPENLREPFYRDHENQEHLKPQISGALANAELYCLALGHIYSDPNYHNLNHWAILQTLSRKGVYDQDHPETEITETILIQTNPLRMNAHMAVIESIMVLYAKEVASGDQISVAIQRIGQVGAGPCDPERGLLSWVNGACNALQQRIGQEASNSDDVKAEGDRRQAPKLPTAISSLKDLSDGVALAALISYYCPDDLPWSEFIVSYIPSVSESLHNLMLVYNFCQRHLPCSVFHMMPEDITYMRSSMKQNLIVFLADLFNVLEIHPIKCVRYPGMDRPISATSGRNSQGVAHKRNLPPTVVTPIPDLRSGLDTPPPGANFTVPRNSSSNMMPLKKSVIYPSASEFSEDSLFRRDSEESFVVHRSRGVPTLSSVLQGDEPLIPARLRPAKEKQNNDTKAEERGDGRQTAAGKPSHWEDTRKSSYAGRRSRRNSFSDDSQLTIENFGGSQDHLNFIGRNPDKDFAVHVSRKISMPETVQPARSSIQDARGSIQLGFEEYSEKQDSEREKSDKMKSNENVSARKPVHKDESSLMINDVIDGDLTNKMASFADLSKAKIGDQKGIHIVYMQHEKEENAKPSKSSLMNKKPGTTNGSGEKKTTTFATLPNTTTWQQQSSSNQQMQAMNANHEEAPTGGNVMASQLNNIRMKLEEKRRHIESEKRRMELIMNKQRQKVGKAAFLQAVSKGKSNLLKGAESAETEGDSAQAVSESALPDKPQRPFSLKEISDDAQSVEQKWLESDGVAPFVETRKTPDIENMDLEQYQQSLALMNNSLHDIQADIQRLASQQNQIQHQNLMVQHQQQMQALAAQHQQHLQHYASSHNISPQAAHLNQMHHMFSSASHIPQNLHQQAAVQPAESAQFYLHDQQQPPTQPHRRTWTQPVVSTSPASHPIPTSRTYSAPLPQQHQQQHQQQQHQQQHQQQPEIRTWGSKPQTYSQQHLQEASRYQNGEQSMGNNHLSYTVCSPPHQQQQQQQQQLFSGVNTPTSSPQHRNNVKSGVHRQISHMLSSGLDGPVNLKQMEHQDRTLSRSSSVIHAPVPVPSVDDMEPQNISFIGNDEVAHHLSEGLTRLNITSGSRTYRIPSPTRPSISRNSFQTPQESSNNSVDQSENEKGFYISFDNEQPKRPKPPLRVKRMSPKKERSGLEDDLIVPSRRHQIASAPPDYDRSGSTTVRDLDRVPVSSRHEEIHSPTASPTIFAQGIERRVSRDKSPSAIIIGSEPDPNSLDEMEKKKERIMLLSLQRRQQQEEAKSRKEAESSARREREKAKEEERARKKEEQVQRRAAILEQYKLKKAIEEAEREGKILDKSELMIKPTPKLRAKTTGRPRPKTIHVDSGSVDLAEGMLTPSRGKKGSTSNLTNTNTYNPSSMRRDYYRGSHDSLADTGMSAGSLYRDSPDDGRGASPCRSVNQTLGRRASYKTSRDNVHEAGQVRGRPKLPTYQNFRVGGGRKSNSMMNLCGSSSDQDSMMYRYGDTDSGLGRATPPRRAPSPGMGPMRHLPSPSGPGSLPPGLMTKRRMFDDGCSDISSTPSSMMDYSGPRLYKQPVTKSNRGIMLNAVEYCVFPGVVNKEAKRRVLEEIARSESKHFLILFRDAGCQFRALYSYCPERDEVAKLYGTGPKQVHQNMFDKFFKYNSGGKCFSQVHTKTLTVTIDAFTIHNALWQGKKVNLPNKKDMALVI